MAPFNQAGDQGHIAKCAPQKIGFGQPRLQIIAQHILVKQGVHLPHLVQAPYRQGIFRRDKAEGAIARPFHAPGQQHAQGLVGQSAFKGIADQIMLAAAGEALHQQAVRARQDRAAALQGQPVPDLRRQAAVGLCIGQQHPHAGSQIGG